MYTHIKKYCREVTSLAISVCSDSFPPFLGLTLLSLLPASLYGCSAPEALPDTKTVICTKISTGQATCPMEDIDIFVFNDDRMQLLDCYQRVEDPSSWNNEIVSTSGDRIITVCANAGKKMNEWFRISSLPHFREITMSLEEDSMRHPLMSGISHSPSAGESRRTDINLFPLMSIVELRSIRCDFSQRPYAGEKMTDVKVYLTNISGECRIMDSENILPLRIINAGRLREDDMKRFEDPGMTMQEIPVQIGKETIHPRIELACYPNNSLVEGPGTPFTRMVVEAQVQGETFYWPLDINRQENGYGIGRNERYIFDLTITRKGVKDPDTPICAEDMDITFTIEKWNEKQDCPITF